MQQSSQSSDFRGIFSDSLSEEAQSHSQMSKNSHSHFSQYSSEFSQPDSRYSQNRSHSLISSGKPPKKTKKALMKEKPIRKHPKPSMDHQKSAKEQKKQSQQYISIIDNSIIDSLLASANQAEYNPNDNQNQLQQNYWGNHLAQSIAEGNSEVEASVKDDKQQVVPKNSDMLHEEQSQHEDNLKVIIKNDKDSERNSIGSESHKKEQSLQKLDNTKSRQIHSHTLTNTKSSTYRQGYEMQKQSAKRHRQKPKHFRTYSIPKINRQQYLIQMSCLSQQTEGPINLLNLNFHEVLKQFYDVISELKIDPGIFDFVPELVEENEAISSYLQSIMTKVQVKSSSVKNLKVLLNGLENFQIQELVQKVNKGDLNSVKASSHSQSGVTRILTPADHRYYAMFLYKLCQILAKLEHNPALNKLALKYAEKFKNVEESTATFYSVDTTEFMRFLYAMSEDEYDLFREKCRKIAMGSIQEEQLKSNRLLSVKQQREKTGTAGWKGPKNDDWAKTISKIRYSSQQPIQVPKIHQATGTIYPTAQRGKPESIYSQSSHEQSIDFSKNHRNRAQKKTITGSKASRRRNTIRPQGHGTQPKQQSSVFQSNTVTNKQDIFLSSDEEYSKKKFQQQESDFPSCSRQKHRAKKVEDSFLDSANIDSNTFNSGSEANDDDVSSTDTEIFLQGQREALMRYVIKQSLEEGLVQYKRTIPRAHTNWDVIGESQNLKFALIKKEVINQKKSQNANFKIKKPGSREKLKHRGSIKVKDLLQSFGEQESQGTDRNGLYAASFTPKPYEHDQSLQSDYEQSVYDPGLINFENDMQQEQQTRRLRRNRTSTLHIEQIKPQQPHIFEEQSLSANSSKIVKRRRKNSMHSKQNSSVISSQAYTSEDDEKSSFSQSYSQTESIRQNMKRSNWARFQSYYNNDSGEDSFSVSQFSNGVKRAEKKFWRNHEKFKNNGVKQKVKVPKGQKIDWENIPIVNINKNDDGVESLEDQIHNSIYSKSSSSKINLQKLVSQKIRLKDEI